MKKIWVAIALTSMYSLNVQAAPQINIGGFYDFLDGKSSMFTKRVRNTGSSTAFVEVSVLELVYDTTGASQEIPIDGDFAKRSLRASPRLIIPASGMQLVRLSYQGDRSKERYYRVRFIPVLPKSGDGFALAQDEAEQYKKEVSAGVEILTGYGSILYVKPAQEVYSTVFDDQAQKVLVRNDGNSTVTLDNIRDCDATGEQCAAEFKRHLRPGESLDLPKVSGRRYDLQLVEGKHEKHYEFKVKS